MAIQFRPWRFPSDEELEFLNEHNAPLRFERTLDGELSLSPPTGFTTGARNSELNRQLANWNIAHGHGYVIDSSTGISIGLNGAPDGGWLSGERLRSIPPEQREKFLRIAPEIVFELRSPNDWEPAIARRADEWVAVGVKVAVVLDPVARIAIPHDESGPRPAVTSGTLRIDKALLPGASEDLGLDLFAIFDAGA
jgi:Uma2 family endonuclease